MDTLNKHLLDEAIEGQQPAIRELIKHLTPVIQRAVASTLLNGFVSYHGDAIRNDIADFCQEIFILLFNQDCKVLKQWQPEKGMSLESFVSLISKRRVISSMRSVKPVLHADFATDVSLFENLFDTRNIEKNTIDKNMLSVIFQRLKLEISEFGYRVFIELFLYESTPEEIERNIGLNKNSIYVWRNRLRCRMAEIYHDLEKNS